MNMKMNPPRRACWPNGRPATWANPWLNPTGGNYQNYVVASEYHARNAYDHFAFARGLGPKRVPETC